MSLRKETKKLAKLRPPGIWRYYHNECFEAEEIPEEAIFTKKQISGERAIIRGVPDCDSCGDRFKDEDKVTLIWDISED